MIEPGLAAIYGTFVIVVSVSMWIYSRRKYSLLALAAEERHDSIASYAPSSMTGSGSPPLLRRTASSGGADSGLPP